MNPNPIPRGRSGRSLTSLLQLLAGAGALLASVCVRGQGLEFEQPNPTPGGVSPFPVITSIQESPAKDSVLIKWIGVQGPYQIQHKDAVAGATWTDVGTPGDVKELTHAKTGAAGFFRVLGAPPAYQGAAACAECHGEIYQSWSHTTHANAFQLLKDRGQDKNPACVVCHTVGFGTSGGFTSEAKTPQYANIQCENCHGPGGDHMSSGEVPTVFPIATFSPKMCAGCHNGYMHPTYDEWKSSTHSRVVPDLVADFSSTNRATAIARMGSCGPCHSGAVRSAMLEANSLFTWNDRTNVVFPSGLVATNTPQVCIVCHDQHEVHVYTNVISGTIYTNQIRNPLSSLVNFSYNTATNFASQYNPAVNLCAQCHNARGATVGSSGRPPHYSPQYNILIGTIGVTTDPQPPQGAHRNNPLQCAGCHVFSHGEENPTPAAPAYTGHTFKPTIEACRSCHTDATGDKTATNLLATTQADVKLLVSATKGLLDQWATTKNTNSWAAKYGSLGWEYTAPGELSNPLANPLTVGPSTAEQAQIPAAIKDARYNLYLVSRDKSNGIHNAPYVKYLLSVAQTKVNAELAKP